MVTSTFDLNPVLYMNIYMNGYMTSIDIEQKAVLSPSYLIERNHVTPYPSHECTREFTKNRGLERKLRSLIQKKFNQGQEFGNMLTYISAVRRGEKPVPKIEVQKNEVLKVKNAKIQNANDKSEIKVEINKTDAPSTIEVYSS